MLTKIEMATVYNERSKIGRFFSSHSPAVIYARRPWTLFADMVTDVIERREHSTYDKEILREWVKGVKSIKFRDATPDSVFNTNRYVIKGTEDEIVDSMDSLRTIQKEATYGMQSLKRGDGTMQITVNCTSYKIRVKVVWS